MLLGSPRLRLQQLLHMSIARHMEGTLQRLRHSMHTFCAVSSISTAPSLFRIDAITSLGSSSQFRVVSFFLYTFLVWFFFEGEEEEEGAPFPSILSLEVFSDLGFLEIGIFAFDFDFGQWSGNEISVCLVH